MPPARLPGLITGDLEGDAAIVVIVAALIVALSAFDRQRTWKTRVAAFVVSFALIGAATFLFVDAIKAMPYANVPIDETRAPAGKIVYEENCVACHGVTGRGESAGAARLKTKPPDLTVHAFQHDEAYFILTISGGIGEMPAFKDKLTSEQIGDVINYMRLLARQAQKPR